MMVHNFDTSTIIAVWEKAIKVPGYDPKKYRKDAAGAWMIFNEYGNTNSTFGWEIDHIKPQARGGLSTLYNLQPLQWENNRSKSDSYPSCQYVVTASGEYNVRSVRYCFVA